MSLLAPALLLGLLGLAIPIIAHLLGREPPRTIEFAALRFLSPDEPTVTRRRALQDPLLLALRLVLLALAVMVLARPASFDRTGVAMVAEPHDAVLLIDASASMALRPGDTTMMDRGIARAQTLLESLPSGTRVGLMTSDPSGPLIEPTLDVEQIRSALDKWRGQGAPRWGGWALTDSVARAAGLLRDTAGDRKRVVYAVGDGTERGLAGLPATGEGGALIVPIPAIDPELPRPGHVGIRDVTWTPAPDLDPRALRIEVHVHREAATDAPQLADDVLEVSVVLSVDGQTAARGTAELLPGSDAVVEFTHTLLGEVAEVAASVALELPDDPLPIDDVRHLWLSADDGINVVVVNGDPSELRAHDEVFFLATAISVADRQQRLRLTSLAPDQLEARIRETGERALADIDVLVLANVRAPAEDVVHVIISRVRAGMGLLVTSGDRVDPADYDARLGGILPLRLREQVELGTAPGRTEAVAEGFAPPDLAHPMFRGIGDEISLGSARVRKAILCEPDPRRQASIVIAYTNGAPALIAREAGDGRVAMLTTSIDRDWADLPLRPGFVPLASAMLGWLGDAAALAASARLDVGDPRPLAGSGPFVVTTPEGAEITLSRDDGQPVVFRDTFVVGHYRVRDGDATANFVVGADPRESHTAWQPMATTPVSDDERVAVAIPQWRGLVVILALILAAESLLRLRRRTK